MKKLIFSTIAILALMFSAGARAQTFGGGIPVWGNTNALLMNAGVGVSNTLFGSIPTKSLTLSGITSSNEYFIGYYGFKVNTNLYTLLPGTYDTYVLVLSSNNFIGGTNGGTFTTNFPPSNPAAPFGTFMGITIGSLTNAATTYTNTAYVP
jgi:hypothetical protein